MCIGSLSPTNNAIVMIANKEIELLEMSFLIVYKFIVNSFIGEDALGF